MNRDNLVEAGVMVSVMVCCVVLIATHNDPDGHFKSGLQSLVVAMVMRYTRGILSPGRASDAQPLPAPAPALPPPLPPASKP